MIVQIIESECAAEVNKAHAGRGSDRLLELRKRWSIDHYYFYSASNPLIDFIIKIDVLTVRAMSVSFSKDSHFSGKL